MIRSRCTDEGFWLLPGKARGQILLVRADAHALSECSDWYHGMPMRGGQLMVTLWGRQWSQAGLIARVGRLEQVAGTGKTRPGTST